MSVTKSGRVRGRVQGVMFRQTFVRALLKRGLAGGATNSPDSGDEVVFTLEGDEGSVEEVLNRLGSGEPINSWGAQVESLEMIDEPIPIERHQVTTLNVDEFRWSGGVEFYL
jgi:acylphosphatase